MKETVLIRLGLVALWALVGVALAVPSSVVRAQAPSASVKGNRAWEEAYLRQLKQGDETRSAASAAAARLDYARGEALARQALAVDKTNAQAWVLLADVCERQGRDREAVQAYRAVIYSQGWGGSISHEPTTLMRYVLLLAKVGEWAEAVAIYRDAERRHQAGSSRPLVGFAFDAQTPDWSRMKAAAHFVLGTCRVSYLRGPTPDQFAHLEEAIRYRGKWPEAQAVYGDWMLKRRSLDRAEAAYKIARSSADWGLRLRAQDGLRAVAYCRLHPNEADAPPASATLRK